MSDADCTPGREPRSVAASVSDSYYKKLNSFKAMQTCKQQALITSAVK